MKSEIKPLLLGIKNSRCITVTFGRFYDCTQTLLAKNKHQIDAFVVYKEYERKSSVGKGVCVCVQEEEGDLYSPWCHLRKVLGPLKPSEWMECFFRRPRSTFFHSRTSVCLFLFQIHSIIPDCSKHSTTFQEPHIPFSTRARITTLLLLLLLTLTPAPTQTVLFFFHHSSSWMDTAKEKTLFCLFSLHAEEFGLLQTRESPHTFSTPGLFSVQL